MTCPTPPICCEKQNYNCYQGRHCPKREELWITKTNAELDAELERQWKRDLKSIVFIASCIATFAIIVLVTA